MAQLLIAIVGIVAGAAGYLIATFWVRPILRYHDIKYQVASDLVYYANALDVEREGTVSQPAVERKERNRRHSSDLSALHAVLPRWYKWLLRRRREDPVGAAAALLKLANCSTWRDAEPHEIEARARLRLQR